MINFIITFWPYVLAGITFLLSLVAAGHVILYKRDSRAAVGWVGLIWLAPVIGSLLYGLLGINRIRRKAAGIRGEECKHLASMSAFACTPDELAVNLPDDRKHLARMAHLSAQLIQLDLLRGNRVEILCNGDEAYPAMIEAIHQAKRSVSLTSYIFDDDRSGREFVTALSGAVKRGVEVRVLVDSVGARYSIPPVTRRLRANGVRVAAFMPSYVPWATPFVNLRSHRKILVVDGRTGFTGGMNIREGCVLANQPAHPTPDVHFRLTGPVVQELQATFVEDWHFMTGELLAGDIWFSAPEDCGPVIARAVPDGPDKNYDNMRMVFHGALSVAQQSVRIVTPYFLPDAALITALNTCAMRGVNVDVILPEKNNLKIVAWASIAQMWQILEWGCRVWLTPPPFDHTKLLVVDRAWSLIGSSNWDPRSLRLNFEFGVECYDPALAGRLDALADQRMQMARQLTLDEVNRRSLPVKLRDGVARLFSPYL
ncbi:MAG TPA: cardiolipin synthase [Kiritimatiellia bacterium]|nr:cardiolipin synthase [Kiritimatiellia bacterium]HMO99808.1 cardiolipin synthase [Kiritimatiellia bacterium]HMP97462.1 cardiolipin synthase [Kiritimatiellia bacterium]